MNPDDVKNIIHSTKDQISRLIKDVNESLKAPRTYPTDKPSTSNFYDSSIHSIRDTLENDESFNDFAESASRGYPPRELISSTSKHRSEFEPNYNPGRSGFRNNNFGSSHDQPSYDEYSFHTPNALNDREEPFMKTAEFDYPVENDTEPDYPLNPKRNGRPRINVSQRDSTRDNEEARNMKQVIDTLLSDNQVLNQNVEDFKKATQFLVGKHKELQRKFEIENKRAQRSQLLEQQLLQERAKNKHLTERNFVLRDKCIKLVEFLQQLGSEEQAYTKEEEEVYTHIIAENDHLREILGIARVSDPKFQEIDQYVKDKLNETDATRDREEEKEEGVLNFDGDEEQDEFKITPSVLADFKKDRREMFSMQRTFSVYSEKGSASKPVNTFASTENVLEAALRTPSSSTHSWEQIRFINTSMSSESSRGELSLERTGRTVSSDR